MEIAVKDTMFEKCISAYTLGRMLANNSGISPNDLVQVKVNMKEKYIIFKFKREAHRLDLPDIARAIGCRRVVLGKARDKSVFVGCLY